MFVDGSKGGSNSEFRREMVLSKARTFTVSQVVLKFLNGAERIGQRRTFFRVQQFVFQLRVAHEWQGMFHIADEQRLRSEIIIGQRRTQDKIFDDAGQHR